MKMIRRNMTTNYEESCHFIDSMHNVKSSPIKSKVDSLNKMQQVSGHFVIYEPVLAIKYDNLVA